MDILYKSSSGISQVPVDSELLADRKIFIEGEINADTALEFLKKVMYLNRESEEPISVYINSPGGEVNSGWLYLDVLTGSRAPVKMYCVGKAYSMGAVLFACANERYMLPNSELMLHQPLLGGRVGGNASSLKSISDSLMETKEKMNYILAQRTGKSEEEIDQMIGFDHYFSPQEAIDCNLCDGIIDFAMLMEG